MTDPIPNLVGYRIANPGIPLPPITASLYEYVMAGNGIFIRGARRELQAQFCITPCAVRGLPNLEVSLSLKASRVPREMVEAMLADARAARDADGQPCEIVFHLELDDASVWKCHVPNQSQSSMRAKPNDDSPTSSYAHACIELHSHVDMHPIFSWVDDEDEVGFRVYVVLGLISRKPMMRVRVGMYGYRHDIPANWVFDLPPEIGDAVTCEGAILGLVE